LDNFMRLWVNGDADRGNLRRLQRLLRPEFAATLAIAVSAATLPFVLPNAEAHPLFVLLVILIPQIALLAVVWRSAAPRLQPGRHSKARKATTTIGGPGADGHASAIDSLTGLGSKAAMHALLGQLFSKPETGPARLAAGILDIDGMKPVNERLGYACGDDMLRQCANRLSRALGEKGTVYRYGGDEFAFVIEAFDGSEGLREIAGALRECLSEPFEHGGRKVRLSGCFGFAMRGEGGATIAELTHSIDTALQHSKAQGPGTVTIYTPELEAAVRNKFRMERALRDAVAANRVIPHFQPIVALADGRLCGFEALARWSDPEFGEVSPASFIALAEESGIIGDLTYSLLMQAAQAAAKWPGNYFLSVNLSGVLLADRAIARRICDTVNAAGLKPERLEIEVTESAVMADPETASQILSELHESGVRIAMDDFGTGQSSLGRLRDLVLDKVKIDRAFVKSLDSDKVSKHIARAIIEMCAGLGLGVVAEGIETVGQARTLDAYGCGEGQGFLFGKPRDAASTLAYIRDHQADEEALDFAVAV
jgi:diguanylate cyclase (GGDEF)-like protein